MKVGLSTWSLLGADVNSAVRQVGDAGFDYVELWGEVPHAYQDWTDRSLLKDTLSAYDMDLTMHVPFTDLNPASPFQPVKEAVEKTLEDFVRFGEYLGARYVTLHPGSVHNELLVRQSAANCVSTLKRMVKTGHGEVVVCIENQTKSRSRYHFPLGSTFESLELILAEVEGARFTLDTGHAHVNGLDPLSLADRLWPKLVEVHLSDNMGSADDHLVPGQGSANLEPILNRLKGTDVYVCLELDPHRYSQEQVIRAAMDVKKKMVS